jgi:hypothetical protein
MTWKLANTSITVLLVFLRADATTIHVGTLLSLSSDLSGSQMNEHWDYGKDTFGDELAVHVIPKFLLLVRSIPRVSQLLQSHGWVS